MVKKVEDLMNNQEKYRRNKKWYKDYYQKNKDKIKEYKKEYSKKNRGEQGI